MDYVRLGRTALKVSRFCLGTMNFGPETSEGDAFAIMDRALELGINFFDTANVYGWKKGEGVTEQIIGRWLAQGGGRREKVVLATKVYGEMGDWPNESRLSARHIRAACEGSLRRLRTDHLDLYQMHHVDREAPWDEIWQAMELLVQQGKIIYVGSSNFAGWHIARANEAAARRSFLGLVSEQSKYSLVERSIELEVLPACAAYGMGVIPYSPLASGALAGSGRRAGQGGRRDGEWAQKELARHRPKLEALRALLSGARRGAGRRGARLAAGQPGGHRPDHRPPHPRAAGRRPPRPGDQAGRRAARQAGRDLSGAGQAGAGSVRLVNRETTAGT
jgi:aryl-alcohol dehydrogenase-like predicted oxidoreductase